MEIICSGCSKRPEEIDEYIMAADDEGMTPEQYVREEEGTFNSENGHFLCTSCYVAVGCPSTSRGWVAP
jgi:hypothetical protein